ncbi:hypothetical protein Adt_41497 [Abeliophyllum distichum]|uniref:Uncharacterized protein n=1 Tax=Abeliophyllum distichum TaxID=126358 RepID=A0ABD1PP12_9LAMI
MTEGDMEDLLEASIACSIRAASTSMRSLNALKEYKKKMAGETAKAAEFRADMNGLMATVESAKATYQQMNQNLAEAGGNITDLTKRLDDALAAQAITASALEKANEEKKVLQLSSHSEVSLLKAKLEATAKARSNSEDVYVRILAEKKALEDKLSNAEAEFTANFHNTEAYASFSSFFASVGQQEVHTALRNDFIDFNIAPLEEKFPPVELGDDVEASDAPDE